MITRVKRRWKKDDVLSLFDEIIAEWFNSKYEKLTEPQGYAVPLIHEGKNVLVSSPTGSGKTLTAFISIINELFLLAKNGKLEDKIYCVYISPLKALANDIHRNLEVPLSEIKEIAKKKGIKIPKIRVAVRSGDTSTSERQKMLKKPPHIFITTPESLALALTAPKFREKFKDVRYVIVDEIHEIANNKRGVMLSLNLERLAYYAGEFQRIGLSATQSPIEEIARFLSGYRGEKERDIYVVEAKMRRYMDLRVITPVDNLISTPYEVASERMYDILVNLINKHRTTLIFTNTRSGAEHVAYKLKERGVEKIEAHHGSLSKETRLRVEKDLKEGRLKCVISSTSLELGIDIGYIDLVVQIGSPKSVAKGLQRIGRSGHAYGRRAKGRFVVFDPDDLVECTTLVKCAYEGKIDKIRIPKNSLDVLAQIVVGMSLEKRWDVDEAYKLVRNSYCYHELPKEKMVEVLRYLGGKVLGDTIYSKIWFDEEEMRFGRKRSSRMIYFMNIGTIPDEADYLVIDIDGKRLGDLSEKFVEKLQRGDVFVLGARTYEVVSIRSNRVVVRDASGKRPTIPSWVGEMLPRSFDLSIEVGRFREFVEKNIRERGEEETIEILIKDYYLDKSSAKSIVSYISEGLHHFVPTHRRFVIEGYIDPSGKYNIIFHYPLGRRVNDALSRAYAYRISEIYGVNVGISITDDAFMLTSKKKIPLDALKDILSEEDLEGILRNAIFNTELFKQRFRHVATRAFMVLRKYKGKSISVARQQLRSERILRILHEIPDFPVMEETFNEILNIAMDMPNAKKVLEDMERGYIKIEILNYSDTPSIFAHSIILVGISDIVLMEDRSALLKELHMKLLERIIPAEEIGTVFNEDTIREYFEKKFRIRTREDIIKFLSLAPGADILHRRGINVFDYSDIPEEKMRKYVEEYVSKGKIVSIQTTRLLWTTDNMYSVFSTIYVRECNRTIEWSGEKKVEEIAKELKMKKSEVYESLKCMERAYLAGRKLKNGEFLWYRRESEQIDRDYAIEILIRNLLYFRAPLTFEEILYTLKIGEEDLRRILKYMVDEGTVVKGVFLVGYGEQYMLREDYENLRKMSGMKWEALQNYRASKILKKMNCDEFFERFLVVFNEDSLRLRGCHEELSSLLREGKVLYGRFMGGRLCYTHIKNVPLLVSVYRREELGEEDKKILRIIRLLGEEATIQKVQSMSNYSSWNVKEIVEKLERNLYVYRQRNEGKEYLRELYYEPYGTVVEFIRKILDEYGPLAEHEIERFTSIRFSEYRNLFQRVYVEGMPYYHTGEKINTDSKGTFVVPKEDPFTYPILHRIYDLFNEVGTHIMVKDGKIIATGDVENRIDSFAVHRVEGNKKEFLKELSNREIVILSFNPHIQKFRKIGDYYVSGGISDKVFLRAKIISYLLWKGRIVPERKLANPLEVARFLMGVHSDFELLRSRKKIAVEKYYRSELLYETVDLKGNPIYATKGDISLFQAIRNKRIGKDMKVILSMLEENKKMVLGEIMEESPLGSERTRQALVELYKGNYIAKYSGGYVYVPKKYSEDYGKQVFLENLLRIFGFLNGELVKHFSGGYISREEGTKMLLQSDLNRGLYLNDGKIYYAFENEIESVRVYDEPVVLHPDDPLADFLFEIHPQERGFLVIKGDIVGVVKASQSKRGFKISKYTNDEALEIFKRYF